MDIDWRRHQRWITLEDGPVNVIEIGEGPALLFVHGLAGSWQNWLEQIPIFASEYRVLALDLPGFGHSPMPRQEISITRYCRMLHELLQELGISEAAVVGNSMGGFISAELAISYSECVERLVLVSPAGIYSQKDPRARLIPMMRITEAFLAAYTAWIASKSDTVCRRPRLRQATLNSVMLQPSRIPGPLAAEQLRGSGKPGFIDAFHALSHYPIRDRLSQISCPTLIVWGDTDRLVPTRDADVFEELIPKARKVIYEDTGHVAMLERPSVFNAELTRFLNEKRS
jgi:pimeloyl-ACP methyl ester carboxylesterase